MKTQNDLDLKDFMEASIVVAQIQTERGQADSYLSEITAKLLDLSSSADLRRDPQYAVELEALAYKVQIATARLKRA